VKSVKPFGYLLGREQNVGGNNDQPMMQKMIVVDVADLLAMSLPEPRFAVPGILPEGFTVLAGKPKLGKSWLALDLAVAVASGTKALDSFPVVKGDVLYLALEDPRRRLQDRLNKIFRHMGLSPETLRLSLVTSCPQQDKGGLAEIDNWLQDHPDARLVIIDVWCKFRPGRKNPKDLYQEDYNHGSAVKALADKYGVAVLVIHHTRKGESVDALQSRLGGESPGRQVRRGGVGDPPHQEGRIGGRLGGGQRHQRADRLRRRGSGPAAGPRPPGGDLDGHGP
jgi:hypothetical protein